MRLPHIAALLLAGAAAVALALALAPRREREGNRPTSTLVATFADGDGDGRLERGPGEPLRERTELAPAARPVRSLALLAQISDAHVRDEESPARASLLDRLGPPFTSTFRPQEALSGQTLAAAVASVNELGPEAVLETGDLIDSAQENELDEALAVLRGGRVKAGSGATGYDGPQASSSADPFLYRPDVDAPRHPGLLDRAERPYRSPGLEAPWYPVAGNHDLLVQGEAPRLAALDRLAVGSRRLVEADPSLLRAPVGQEELDPALIERLLSGGLPGRTTPTSPDPRRRHLAPGEALERLRRASGHGGEGPHLDYSFDVGSRLRVIVLDLVRRGGGSDGRVSAAQVAWLRRELRLVGGRCVVVASHQRLESAEGGERALAELDRSPRVVAALAGHTHESSIEPRRSPAGGYWLIGTPSLADYPQQARALRLVETEGGGVALETWMIDTAGGELADASRELAFLDAQGGRPQAASGGSADRNARLYR